jgi:regulatory protein
MASADSNDKSIKKIFLKATSFCAYQERTQQEVREKLYGDNVDKDIVEEVIVKLIEENFLNEERFAKAYAGGKFRMKRWGRLKIENELKMKGVSSYCIKMGLKEIEEDHYKETISALLEKKLKEEKEKNIFKKKSKVANYVIRKGFEPDLVWEMLNDLMDRGRN